MNATLEPIEEEIVESEWSNKKFTACDACGHRAYSRITKESMELFMCSHHKNSHEASLIADGWTIDDQTSDLIAEVEAMKKPSDDNF